MNCRKPVQNCESVVVLPPRFLASVNYYRVVARNRYTVIDSDIRFNKRQKDVHRTTIADVHGKLNLTVPVAKPSTPFKSTRWSDIRVSTHDGWWQPMWNTIESAYGRTPFFEFYADRFKPFFHPRSTDSCEPITMLDMELHDLITDILHLPRSLKAIPATNTLPVTDYTTRELPALQSPSPYYQVRSRQLDFIPDLSVIDLIFNLGPEAELYIFS